MGEGRKIRGIGISNRDSVFGQNKPWTGNASHSSIKVYLLHSNCTVNTDFLKLNSKAKFSHRWSKKTNSRERKASTSVHQLASQTRTPVWWSNTRVLNFADSSQEWIRPKPTIDFFSADEYLIYLDSVISYTTRCSFDCLSHGFLENRDAIFSRKCSTLVSDGSFLLVIRKMHELVLKYLLLLCLIIYKQARPSSEATSKIHLSWILRFRVIQ